MSYLYLETAFRQQLFQQATESVPHEICGLIAGTAQTATRLIPIANVAEDPERHFVMDNQQLLQAFKQLDRDNLMLLALYHSHPSGRAIPSPEDVAAAATQYPGMIQLIIAPHPEKAKQHMKAWVIESDHRVRAAHLLLPGDILDDDDLSDVQVSVLLISAMLAFITLILVSINLLPPAPPLS